MEEEKEASTPSTEKVDEGSAEGGEDATATEGGTNTETSAVEGPPSASEEDTELASEAGAKEENATAESSGPDGQETTAAAETSSATTTGADGAMEGDASGQGDDGTTTDAEVSFKDDESGTSGTGTEGDKGVNQNSSSSPLKPSAGEGGEGQTAASPTPSNGTEGGETLDEDDKRAMEIEGFDDDFKDLGDKTTSSHTYTEQDGGLQEAEDMDEDELADEARLSALIEEAQEEYDRLLQENTAQQKTLLNLFLNRKSSDVLGTEQKKIADTSTTRYIQSLAQWVALTDERDRVSNATDLQVLEHRMKLGEKSDKADEVMKTFNDFTREVALQSEHSRTGKILPVKVVENMMSQEERKETEVQRVRLRNIQLRTQVRKLENRLKAKEELAEGLHLIDFEQLKIENQSLNEKIEERNEELLKLRKKTTTTVQVLTHLKEKLQFLHKENDVLEDALADLEAQLSEQRDKTQQIKHELATVKNKNRKFKRQSDVVTTAQLLADMNKQREKKEELILAVEELKTLLKTLHTANLQTLL